MLGKSIYLKLFHLKLNENRFFLKFISLKNQNLNLKLI